MSKFLDDIGLTLLWSKIKQYISDKVPNFIMGPSIGSGPYTIEMSEEEEGDLSASQVSYNNTSTDMESTNVQDAITELYEQIPSPGTNLPTVTMDIDGSSGLWNFMFVSKNGIVEKMSWEPQSGFKKIEVFAGLPVVAYLNNTTYRSYNITIESGLCIGSGFSGYSPSNFGKEDIVCLYPFSNCSIITFAVGGVG